MKFIILKLLWTFITHVKNFFPNKAYKIKTSFFVQPSESCLLLLMHTTLNYFFNK